MKKSIVIPSSLFIIFLFASVVFAADVVVVQKFYSTSGDGCLTAKNTSYNWDAVHDATASNISNDPNVSKIYAQTSYYSGNSYVCIRGFGNFDFSSLPSGASIAAAKLNLFYSGWKSGTHNLYLVNHAQADSYALAVTDFDQCGAVDNPNTGGYISVTDVSTESYTSIDLNSTGLSWLDSGIVKLGLRTQDDVNDTTPTSNQGGSFYSSEEVGTDKDPYLLVTYECDEDDVPNSDNVVSVLHSADYDDDGDVDVYDLDAMQSATLEKIKDLHNQLEYWTQTIWIPEM